jgi:1,4-alpha-glucan branching enzyme
MLVICNFTPAPRENYRVGVPRAGVYAERINTDSTYYGGSNVGTPYGHASSQDVSWHGKAHSLLLTVPPLATLMFEWKA